MKFSLLTRVLAIMFAVDFLVDAAKHEPWDWQFVGLRLCAFVLIGLSQWRKER